MDATFSWLPGYSVFGSHTPVFWINFLLGGTLGYFATRIRAEGTRYEGVGWMLGLGVVAGLVSGTTIFAFWGLVVMMMALTSGRMGGTFQLAVLSMLSQVLLFVYLVLRRGYR